MNIVSVWTAYYLTNVVSPSAGVGSVHPPQDVLDHLLDLEALPAEVSPRARLHDRLGQGPNNNK